MSVFSSSIIKTYNMGSWEVTETEKLDAKEIKGIERIEVVTKEQEWGESTSMCFFMKAAKDSKKKEVKYIPLSRDSDLENGDLVDPKSVILLTLSKEGEDDIVRADGDILKSSKKSSKKAKEDEEDEEEDDDE